MGRRGGAPGGTPCFAGGSRRRGRRRRPCRCSTRGGRRCVVVEGPVGGEVVAAEAVDAGVEAGIALSCATTCFMPRLGMGACGLRQAPPATHAMRRRSEGGDGGVGGGAGGARALAESAKMIMLADASEASSSDASEAQSGESGRANEASETCGVKRTAVNCDKLKQLEFSGAGVREALCSCSPYSRTLQQAASRNSLEFAAAPRHQRARVELAYNLKSTPPVELR